MGIKAALYNGGSEPVELTPRNGMVYKDEYNETRDSATIVVHSRDHIDIEPFDFVRLYGSVRGTNIREKRLDVDSVYEDQTSFGEDPSYDTTITLFSETKEMERITLPNLSITSRADGTSRSVASYIREYMSLYAPKYRVASGGSYSFDSAWTISTRVQQRFGSIDCPEFSWNRPTLCEVITDLMQVDDCIPIIDSHELDFIDLRERKGEANSANFVRVVRGMNSQDYNQNLSVSMQNAISTKPAHLVEYISMRNEDAAILTTDNMQVITQKPIYEIKKVSVVLLLNTDLNTSSPPYGYRRFQEIDITDSIKEKRAYDVLLPSPIEIGGSDYYERMERFHSRQQTHQIANVWFTRGGRSIDGFGKVFQFYNRNEMAIHYIIRGSLGEADATDTFLYIDWRDLMFKVEYMSQGEVKVEAGKILPLRNAHNKAFDNQGSSYVDVWQQSIFEYAKANRLANRIIEINGRCFRDQDVPALGQTYQGSVIFSREIEYFDDCILFHLYATDNYVLTNYFTAVRSKSRSWAIAEGKEALTRHENVKIYAEFSTTSKSDTREIAAASLAFQNPTVERVLSPFFHFFNDETIKLAMIYTEDASSNRYPIPEAGDTNTAYVVDCQASATGMSVSLSLQLSDNYSAGEKVTIDDNSRYINNILPYADANGEFEELNAAFVSWCDPADGDFVWGGFGTNSSRNAITVGYPRNDNNGSGYTDGDFNQAHYEKARRKPISSDYTASEIQLNATVSTRKDNREIFALTAQIEYCSDSPLIIVKEKMAEDCFMLKGEQESYSGLPILASATIMTPETLPEAPTTTPQPYGSVGFLYRDIANYGQTLKIARTAFVSNAVVWQFSDIAADQKFAIIDGYYESASNAAPSTRYIGSRIRVCKINQSKTAIAFSELSIRLFTLTRAIAESEDVVPSAATIIDNPSSVTIEQYATNSYRIRYTAGLLTKCWGLCDGDGKIYFAINATGPTNATAVFVNLMPTRDSTIRQSIASRHIVVGNV